MPDTTALPATGHLGSPLNTAKMAQPPGLTRVLGIASLALVSGVALALFIEAQQRTTFQGVLEAKPYELTADDLLLISQVHTAPGHLIRKGEVVISLANEAAREELAEIDERIAAVESEYQQQTALAELEIGSAKRQIEHQVYSTQMQLAEYQQAVYAAEVTAMAWEQVLKKEDQQRFARHSLSMAPSLTIPESTPEDWLSQTRPEQETILTMLKYASTMNSLEVSKTQVSLCETRLSQLDAELAQARELVYQSRGIVHKQNLLEQLKARRMELETSVGDPKLTSPINGLMGDVHVRPNQAAERGQTLASIYDLDQLTIDAQIDTAQIGHFATGQKVHLRFPGVFHADGRVRQIARRATYATQTSLPVDKAYVHVVIEPHGRAWPEVPLGSVVEIQLQ